MSINFFGHAKVGVKNFSEFFHLQNTMDSKFFRKGVWAPTFLVTLNFLEFSNYRALCTLNFSELMSEHQHFFITLNLRSKFIAIFLFTECSGL